MLSVQTMYWRVVLATHSCGSSSKLLKVYVGFWSDTKVVFIGSVTFICTPFSRKRILASLIRLNVCALWAVVSARRVASL